MAWLSTHNIRDRKIMIDIDDDIWFAKTPGCPLRAGIVFY